MPKPYNLGKFYRKEKTHGKEENESGILCQSEVTR